MQASVVGIAVGMVVAEVFLAGGEEEKSKESLTPDPSPNGEGSI
jgi:hypothetical protein